MIFAGLLCCTLASPPNVLLINLDDLGIDQIGVYAVGAEATQPRTPQLDGLAERGTWFETCYSYPSCKPSRAILLTGRYGFRTGIGSTVNASHLTLDPDEQTLAEALGVAGYATMFVGKWGLGGVKNPFIEPRNHGFQRSAGTQGNVGTYFERKVWVTDESGTTSERPPYLTTWETDQAIAAIQELPKPWFVYANYHAAHGPVHDPPASLHSLPSLSSRGDRFRAMVESVDAEVGRLLQAVDPTDTYVFVFGDNGTDTEFASHPGRGFKGSLYEGGVRVPLLVIGPEVGKGKRSEVLVSLVDVYSTVLQLAGAGSTGLGEVDSISFAHALTGAPGAARRFVYAERFNFQGARPDYYLSRMVRNHQYKLIEDSLSGRTEFYDLTCSPAQDGPPLKKLDEDQQRNFDELQSFLSGLPLPKIPEEAREQGELPSGSPPDPGTMKKNGRGGGE